MSGVAFVIGGIAGVALVSLLAFAYFERRFQFWPVPSAASWQSVLFWTLFRLANGAVLILAAIDFARPDDMMAPRALALAVGLTSLAVYGIAIASLGRKNLYCGKAGLVTGGIYRWSRNPQYAAIIPAYLGLTAAAASPRGVMLAALVALVFLGMALMEERWLDVAYPETYARYKAAVPRFYNVRRLALLLFVLFTRLATHLRRAAPNDRLTPVPATSAQIRRRYRGLTAMERRRPGSGRRSP